MRKALANCTFSAFLFMLLVVASMRRVLKEHFGLMVSILVTYWCLLFVLTHLPSRYVPDVVDVSDWLAHLFGYAVLAALWGIALRLQGRLNRATAVLVAAVLGGYGALDEWTQQFVPGRSAELTDWGADLLGTVLGLGLAWAAALLWPLAQRQLERWRPAAVRQT